MVGHSREKSCQDGYNKTIACKKLNSKYQFWKESDTQDVYCETYMAVGKAQELHRECILKQKLN